MTSASLILLAAATAVAFSPGQLEERFTAALDGEQMVPPVVTSAGAVANFVILGDTAIQFDLRAARIRDVWHAGLYAAETDKMGPKALTLFVGPKAGEFTGTLAEGTLRDQDMLGDISLKDLIDLMRRKKVYVSIMTAAHPEGELRGQVIPAQEFEKRIAVESKASLVY